MTRSKNRLLRNVAALALVGLTTSGCSFSFSGMWDSIVAFFGGEEETAVAATAPPTKMLPTGTHCVKDGKYLLLTPTFCAKVGGVMVSSGAEAAAAQQAPVQPALGQPHAAQPFAGQQAPAASRPAPPHGYGAQQPGGQWPPAHASQGQPTAVYHATPQPASGGTQRQAAPVARSAPTTIRPAAPASVQQPVQARNAPAAPAAPRQPAPQRPVSKVTGLPAPTAAPTSGETRTEEAARIVQERASAGLQSQPGDYRPDDYKAALPARLTARPLDAAPAPAPASAARPARAAPPSTPGA